MKLKFLDTIQKAFDKALLVEVDLDSMNYIIFSDHHRGTGDRADDHRFASATYEQALSYYEQSDATLVLLGDVEELWENPIHSVLEYYQEITSQEMKFDEDSRYLRIWGNHDAEWRSRKFVKRYLGSERPAHEAIKLQVMDEGRLLGHIFLIHGHQGSTFSDEYARFSKFFVRYFWRHFQRIFNKPLDTAATSTRMRSKHDRKYYGWARGHNHDVIVITGHSHEPVFNSFTYADRLRVDLSRLSEKERAGILTPREAASLDEVRKRTDALTKHDATLLNPGGRAIPCYFNTGCCSFSDGEITGIEIVDREIRLIKWTPDGQRKIIQKERLKRIFELLDLDAQITSGTE
ncbi:metallophosphoesterase [Fulvivirga sedimenti]|uniref:Metallophosphoesterase family protein n=1 Tax=Fulvivirga sedimenti TaxID=2879465 RepID=A0A9X1HLB0_9BACT|nr:metallophosphoesterase [Fulvivirga sedimenti]MCA6074349.1 metallophosphoesterase family protein [Fulvivirga sedimenti]